LEVAVSSWKLAWLDCKHRLGFPEVIDDISGTIHLLRFVWKVIVWKQDTSRPYIYQICFKNPYKNLLFGILASL